VTVADRVFLIATPAFLQYFGLTLLSDQTSQPCNGELKRHP